MERQPAQHEHDEFIEDWAAAQILPGPNVVNLSIAGGRPLLGLRGALVAVAEHVAAAHAAAAGRGHARAAFAAHP